MDSELPAPSPKFQTYVEALVERLANVAVETLTLELKPADGPAITVAMLVWELVLLPAALLTVNVAV